MRKALGLVFVAIFAALASAQNPSGTINGTVTDASKAAVANAQVQAVNEDNNAATTVTTNGGGQFSFPNLPVGTYVVAVTAPGLDGEADDIPVNDGEVSTLSIQLEAAEGDDSGDGGANASQPAANSQPQPNNPPQRQPVQTNPNTAGTNDSTPAGMIDLGAPPLAPAEMDAVMTWIAAQVAAINLPYCYRQSYGNGAGEPYTCRGGFERNGLVCYPNCRDGFAGNGPVCWQSCPADFRNDPDHCGKPASYGRGAGYVIWQGDQCNKDNSQGCEQSGALWYPKCRANFHAAGCCVCSPDCPQGMTDIGVSCQKQSYGRGAGEPLAMGVCAPGLQKDPSGALCYPTCKADFHMIGPVCWQNCPSQQPFDCGVGCSMNQKECVSGTFDMVLAPIELAASLIPYAGEIAGAAHGVTAGAEAVAKGVQLGTDAGRIAKASAALKGTYSSLKVSLNGIKAGDFAKVVDPESLAKLTGKRLAGKAGGQVYTLGTDINKQIDLYSRQYADNFDQLTSPAIAAQIDQRFGKVGAYQVKRQWGVRHLLLTLNSDGFADQVHTISELSTADFTGVLSVVSAYMKPVCGNNAVFPTVNPIYSY